jgi:hypothetical protein
MSDDATPGEHGAEFNALVADLMNSLALQVQQALGRDPYAGDLYVFRGRRGCPGNSTTSCVPRGLPMCVVAGALQQRGDCGVACRAMAAPHYEIGQFQ